MRHRLAASTLAVLATTALTTPAPASATIGFNGCTAGSVVIYDLCWFVANGDVAFFAVGTGAWHIDAYRNGSRIHAYWNDATWAGVIPEVNAGDLVVVKAYTGRTGIPLYVTVQDIATP